jgi:hypothetical protein
LDAELRKAEDLIDQHESLVSKHNRRMLKEAKERQRQREAEERQF